MRIYDPRNHYGDALLSATDVSKTSLQLEKVLEHNGRLTITADDIPDIEKWELSSAGVIIGEQRVPFIADSVRETDGSLTIVFGEEDEHLDFFYVSLMLTRAGSASIPVEMEVTIEMKINRLMAKTIAKSGSFTPEERTANIGEWKALGVEAKTKEAANYPYADCSTAEQLTTAGLNPSIATTIGKDVCLISFDGFNNSDSGTRTFPNVQTFEADLPSLINGNYAFYNQTNLQTFKGQFPNVQNATGMFQNCKGLTEWTVELPSGLSNATSMFQLCTGLTQWTVELPSGLSNATSMFYLCTGLTQWTVDLPSGLSNATSMFQNCTGLTQWTVDLPSGLSNASAMFYRCTGLTEWTIDLPSGLSTTSQMFQSCTGLTEWTVELPSGLSNASYMFYGCTGLTQWTVELPSGLSDASRMFQNCTGLMQWTVELPSGLSDASYMFSGCTSLTQWTVELPSGLSDASYMFSGCKLNKASVQKIADSIPTVSGSHSITIGIDSTQITQAEQDAFNTTIIGKGWSTTWQRN